MISRSRRWPIWLRASQDDAAGQAAVADDGDDVVLLARLVPGDGHAQGGREGRRGVAGVVGVVLALLAAGEAEDAAAAAQAAEAVLPAGQDLVGVALVADVPDDLVAGRVEDAGGGPGSARRRPGSRPRWPPFLETVSRMRARISRARVGELVRRELAEVGRLADRIEDLGHGRFRRVRRCRRPPPSRPSSVSASKSSALRFPFSSLSRISTLRSALSSSSRRKRAILTPFSNRASDSLREMPPFSSLATICFEVGQGLFESQVGHDPSFRNRDSSELLRGRPTRPGR